MDCCGNKNKHSSKHTILMILACIIPLGIVILLPMAGIQSKWTNIGAIALMLIGHIWIFKDNGDKK